MCLGAQNNRLNQSVLFITHKVCFFVEKIDFKLLSMHSGCMILAPKFVIYGLIVNRTQI